MSESPVQSDEATSASEQSSAAKPGVQRHVVASGLAGFAAIMVLVISISLAEIGTLPRAGLIIASLVTLVAGGLFFRRVSRAEASAAEMLKEAQEKFDASEQANDDLTQLRDAAEQRLKEISGELQDREQRLNQRLLRFHEWLEYPLDTDDASSEDDEMRLSVDESEELAELQRKDQQVQELLEDESRILFDKILKNEYSINGKFDYRLLRDDALELATRVARVYKPDSAQPLLETSMTQVLQALSRASLHFIILLEEMPIDVREMSISEIYSYVRRAVAAYGTYKAAKPYLAYARGAYYAGRIALGANPMFLGAEFVVRTLGTKGATMLAAKYVNQQAVTLLTSGVRIIGYEVAHIYGGNFRHRDPNWILGCEIVELAASMPLTRKTLSAALQRLTALQLRSEYDRIFLYRCLAQQKSVRPGRFKPNVVLSIRQRQSIARTIESLIRDDFGLALTSRDFEKWRKGYEGRHEITLEFSDEESALSTEVQFESAMRSLTGFGLDLKDLAASDVLSAVESGKTVSTVDSDLRTSTLNALKSNPPFFFEYPQLASTEPISEAYLDDLIRLTTETNPISEGIDDVVIDVGISLRRSESAMRKRINQAYLDILNRDFPPGEDRQWLPEFARAVLAGLDENEKPIAMYSGVEIDSTSGPKLDEKLALVISDQRCVLLGTGSGVIWQANDSTKLERKSGVLRSTAQIAGGEWKLADYLGSGLRVPGETFGSYDDYFKPLTDRLK